MNYGPSWVGRAVLELLRTRRAGDPRERGGRAAHARAAVRRALLAAALAAAGSGLAASSAGAAEGDCPRRVAALEASMTSLTIGDHLSFTTAVFGPSAPTVERAEVVRTPGIVVEVKGTDAAIEGVRLEAKVGPGLAAGVKKHMDALRDAEAGMPGAEGAEPMPAYAWFDRGLKLEDTLGALCATAEARPTHLVVVRRDAKPEVKPKVTPPKWVADELKTADEIPNARPSLLSRSLRRAIGRCEAIEDGLAKLSSQPAAQGRGFKTAIVEGLRACKCQGADIDALEALVVLAISDGPTRWSLPLPLRCGAKDAAELTLPKGATIATLAEALSKRGADAGKPLRIALRASR